MSFLDEVLDLKRLEVDRLRENPPCTAIRECGSAFAAALRRPRLSVIAEIKRGSPSKGALAPDLDVAKTARAYQEGGASALSCLTDRTFFGAQADDFAHARRADLPVLRKDFLIDALQVDESAAMGATAILLIVRILEPPQLLTLLRHARMRGLEALVEVHDESEIDQALEAGASILGVNNRDLKTLLVDPVRALRLRPRIPKGVVSVSESGIRTRDDVKRIEDAGFDAVLIGEALSTSKDPGATLRELMGETALVMR